jgi:DNA mismatch endonuclease (patch repair protein)
VFPRFRAVIFVHGCYWHSHGCYRSTVPKTRRKFWTDKFHTNRLRDINAVRLLIQEGWRVLTVWECAISGKTSRSSASIVQEVKLWLDSPENLGVITGTGFF